MSRWALLEVSRTCKAGFFFGNEENHEVHWYHKRLVWVLGALHSDAMAVGSELITRVRITKHEQ